MGNQRLKGNSACVPDDTDSRPSHHPVLRPRVPAAGVEFLVLAIDRFVNGLRVEGGVDVPQQRDDVRIAVAEGEVPGTRLFSPGLTLPEPSLASGTS